MISDHSFGALSILLSDIPQWPPDLACSAGHVLQRPTFCGNLHILHNRLLHSMHCNNLGSTCVKLSQRISHDAQQSPGASECNLAGGK
jgi:hypothetical protein